jgi:hypothetical protein
MRKGAVMTDADAQLTVRSHKICTRQSGMSTESESDVQRKVNNIEEQDRNERSIVTRTLLQTLHATKHLAF